MADAASPTQAPAATAATAPLIARRAPGIASPALLTASAGYHPSAGYRPSAGGSAGYHPSAGGVLTATAAPASAAAAFAGLGERGSGLGAHGSGVPVVASARDVASLDAFTSGALDRLLH